MKFLNYCTFNFSDQSLTKIDKEGTSHIREKFKCHICFKTFTTKQGLEKHERIHTGEKPFECDICGHNFFQLSNLKSHNKTHTEEKNFKCDVFGKQFKHKHNLSLHLKIHTGEKKNCL